MNIVRDGLQTRFDVAAPGRRQTLPVKLNRPGTHNVLNALAAIAVATRARGCGRCDPVARSRVPRHRSSLAAERRRADTAVGRVTLIDDYGHHPTELAATLEAIRQGWPDRRIVLAFQPHRYTRTRDLLDDFASVLAGVDALIVTEVYAAGEAPIAGADGKAICRAVRSHGRVEPVFVEKIEELPHALMRIVRDGDVIVTMGAGSIGALAADLPAAPCGGAGSSGALMNALALPPDFDARVLRNEPMAKHTSWHVGGPADLFFTPRDGADLAAFLRELEAATPVMWIGLGSNLLVRDGGIRGAVIDTHGVFDELERVDDNEVWCGAGVACAKLAKQCIKWGLGPAEFFAGIPGTLGGALAMNAGAFGGETWKHVLSVATLDREGVRRERPASDYHVGYRHVQGPANEWFLGARAAFRATSGREQR